MTRLLLAALASAFGIGVASAQAPPTPMPPTPASTELLQAPSPIDACNDPCPASCPTVCPTVRGPRARIVIPHPIITFRKCGTRVVEASCPPELCPTMAPPCQPSCQIPYGASGPRMTTVMVPYTYYVQVPTYGVVPTAGYGAAPVSYGAAPGAYGAAPVAYGTAPVAYGIAPVSYGAAPVAYGAAPVAPPQMVYGAAPVYGAPPADDCKKSLGEINAKIEKLKTDVADLKKSNELHDKTLELHDLAFVETVKALQRHQDQINALKKIASDDSQLKGLEGAPRLKKITDLEEAEKTLRESKPK